MVSPDLVGVSGGRITGKGLVVLTARNETEPVFERRPSTASLKRVVLAISAFQSDEEVIPMLRQLFAHGDNPFSAVVVVDSLSSGAVQNAIEANRWPVHFFNAATNLGAAGNLCKRMEMAAQFDADWCYALNGDGELKLETVRALVTCGTGKERIGAVFPLRASSSAAQQWSAAGKSFLPFRSPLRRAQNAPDEQEVAWASSNGALYHLAPARAGVFVWTDFWHAWEDLAYSWLLSSNGWKQIVCNEAIFVDDYERRKVRMFGKNLYIHDKPPWLSYYSIRNLMLFMARTRAGGRGWGVVLWRLLQEACLTIIYRDHKLHRLIFLTRGFIDGLRHRTGITVTPRSYGGSNAASEA